MSVNLSKMVGRAEKEVAQFVQQMEEKLLYPSTDVRLLAEVTQSVKQKIAELGLDPHDTTDEELYHTLRAKFRSDCAQIDRALGFADATNLNQKIEQAVKFVQQIHGQEKVWALKNTVAKQLLRSLPPKKTMAHWHYRSLESLLKRERPAKILLLAQYLEPASWQRALSQAVAKLSVADYEERPVDYAVLANGKREGPPDFVFVSKLTGSLAIWSDLKLEKASGLALVLLLTRGLHKLDIKADPKTIAQTHPALNWWADANHLLALHSDKPVSLNLHDVATNDLHSHDFAQSSTYWGGQQLWSQLLARYEKLGAGMLEDIEGQIEDAAKKLKIPSAKALAEEMVNV